MSLADAIANALIEAAAALERNQADIDFTEAVLARGGPDAEGMEDALIRLERDRANLLSARDSLLVADAEVADSPSAR